MCGAIILRESGDGSRRVVSGKWAGVEPMEPKKSIWINLLGQTKLRECTFPSRTIRQKISTSAGAPDHHALRMCCCLSISRANKADRLRILYNNEQEMPEKPHKLQLIGTVLYDVYTPVSGHIQWACVQSQPANGAGYDSSSSS